MQIKLLTISLFITLNFIAYIGAYNEISQLIIRSLDISVQDYSIRLQTNVNRYIRTIKTKRVQSNNKKPITSNSKVQVDLYGMLHIGDKIYYDEISNQMKQYDIILYELITSEDNIDFSEQVDLNKNEELFKKKLKTNVYSTQMENLGKSFNLTNQLHELDLLQTNWYIADLSSNIISVLETENRIQVIFNYWLNQLFGRNYSEQLLKKLLISDQVLVSLLRTLVWLVPCPELSCLLLDWSRMPSPLYAGGFALLLKPIMQHSFDSNWQNVNKLLFAQQLLSGTIDAGSWGGDSKSDIEVRIKARNNECIRILDGFINEYTNSLSMKSIMHQTNNSSYSDMNINENEIIDESSSEVLKVAILYGIYHINDLNKKLIEEMQFKPDLSYKPKQFTAWNIPAPILASSTAVNSIQIPTTVINNNKYFSETTLVPVKQISNKEQTNDIINSSSYSTALDIKDIFILSSCLIVYLVVGAIDWWILYQFILHSLKYLYIVPSSTITTTSTINVYNSFYNTLELNNYQQEAALTMIYLISYIQRHMLLLKKISYIGIQWDRGLFSDL